MLLFSEGTETGGPRKGRGLPIFHPYLGERRWQTGTAECREGSANPLPRNTWSQIRRAKRPGSSPGFPSSNVPLENVGAGDGIRTRDILLGRNGVTDSSAADEPRLTSDLPPISRSACRPGSTSHEPAPLSRNYTLLSSVAPSPACCDPAGTERPVPEHHSRSPRWRRCAGSGGHGCGAPKLHPL